METKNVINAEHWLGMVENISHTSAVADIDNLIDLAHGGVD